MYIGDENQVIWPECNSYVNIHTQRIDCFKCYFQIQHCSTSDHKGSLGSFKIPDQFSRATMERLEKKEITDATRNEIISSIALPIYQQTTHPTSEE